MMVLNEKSEDYIYAELQFENHEGQYQVLFWFMAVRHQLGDFMLW